MKKNKKILLTILTVFVSMIVFINKVDAVVMWMQCTANSGDVMNHNDALDKRIGFLGDWLMADADSNYKKYNTFALINNKGNESTRNVVYVGNNFFDVQGPTFIMDYSHNGNMSKQACWYNNEYSNDNGPMHECDRDNDFIDVDLLKEGVCPNALYQTTGWNTSGSTKGDFVVMQGTSTPYKIETLNESKLAIYHYEENESTLDYYGKSEPDKYIMIEAYNINGEYGFVYTSDESISSLLGGFGSLFTDNNKDVLAQDGTGLHVEAYGENATFEFDDEFVDYAMATQLVRLSKLGKDYFKIDETEKALLINIGNIEKGTYELINDSDNPILYGNEQWDFVEEWFNKNDNSVLEKIEQIKMFDEGQYQKLIKTAKEINEASDNGKGYNFSSIYDSTKMIEDLNSAYDVLKKALNGQDYKFKYFDADCVEKTTTDAAASLKSGFYCKYFNKNTLKGFNGVNVTVVEAVLDEALLKQVNKLSNNSSSINVFNANDKAKEYAKELAKAAIYLKNNNLIPSDQMGIVNNYTKLVEDFGISLIRDCETLIGEDLKNEITKYTNIIKIAVPIIVIIFGIIDFTKALFSGDEEGMKKSQKTFIKRLVIAILFFFTPVIVNLILSIANKVWTFISPSGCGLF